MKYRKLERMRERGVWRTHACLGLLNIGGREGGGGGGGAT